MRRVESTAGRNWHKIGLNRPPAIPHNTNVRVLGPLDDCSTVRNRTMVARSTYLTQTDHSMRAQTLPNASITDAPQPTPQGERRGTASGGNGRGSGSTVEEGGTGRNAAPEPGRSIPYSVLDAGSWVAVQQCPLVLCDSYPTVRGRTVTATVRYCHCSTQRSHTAHTCQHTWENGLSKTPFSHWYVTWLPVTTH